MAVAIVLGAGMLALLAYVALRTPWTTQPQAALPLSTAPAIGTALLDEWVLPFEIVSLVMLAALLGAAALARKELKE
ncbi:MAG: NADH-quinone oxidoreductase subunit J [Deltaproteobacteria bacterium]|nr:NADH-quinone oxidoreductase subunit J [Deltaproteobacteria bacterium]